MWYVYIVECKDGSLYTGVTTDPGRRLKEHQHAGSHYTSYNPALKLVRTEPFPVSSGAKAVRYGISTLGASDPKN